MHQLVRLFLLPLSLSTWLALGLVNGVQAQESVRDQEIAQCLPGEMVTWGDNRDRPAVGSPMVFVYAHANAPPWFDEALVFSVIEKAASHWSACGVAANVVRHGTSQTLPPWAIHVRWSEVESGGNFGLANFGLRTLVLGPAAFQMLKTRNPAHDARETLQMLVSHEMGHLFGLMAHSRRCVDVTSNYDNGKGEKCIARDISQLRRYVEYRALLPTACDIARCRMANGQK
ncbi:MAG: hypothetical protein K9K38_20040 [Rhodoferax sp.]|nr:hypothetical protein [Rhodoferax sp.]MCF8211666.1 hypothetical protein [Rhodoferax sp.]